MECVSVMPQHLDNYYNLTVFRTVMISESVSLGVLSLPAAVASLGIVPYVRALPLIMDFS